MYQTLMQEGYFVVSSQATLMYQTLMLQTYQTYQTLIQEGFFVEAGAVNGVLDSNSLVSPFKPQHLKHQICAFQKAQIYFTDGIDVNIS